MSLETTAVLLRFRSPRTPGFDKKNAGRGDRADAASTLRSSYRTDAHCVQYLPGNFDDRRMTKAAVGQIPIEMHWVFFDIDNEGHEAPTDTQQQAMRGKIERLDAAHPGLFAYETRHGWRLVYRLKKPFPIESEQHAREWSKHYLITLAYLDRTFGICADVACKDWGRLFRLPHATRESGDGAKPEMLPTFGDPACIGPLFVDFTQQDLEHAIKLEPKTFRARRQIDLAPSSTAGNGLFYRLLLNSGGLGREAERGRSYLIRCPNEQQHTSGVTGDGSTLLYLPASGRDLGAIHCKHAHCVDRTAIEWLGFFTDSEKTRARADAGMAEPVAYTASDARRDLLNWNSAEQTK